MPPRKRSAAGAEARRQNAEQLSRLGADVRASRKRRRLRQADVAERVGMDPSSISRLETGRGGSLSMDTWQLVAIAVGRRLDVRLWADPLREPADVGHLGLQELVLQLGRRAGFVRTFELATRPTDPTRSVDVGLRDDPRRLLVVVECWNTIGDVGAAARASERKRAEAEALAIATAPLDEAGIAVSLRVRSCWVVRATARNRALVARYPHVFGTRFPGSSTQWLRALVGGAEPPAEPGLVWADVAAARLFAWRRRASDATR